MLKKTETDIREDIKKMEEELSSYEEVIETYVKGTEEYNLTLGVITRKKSMIEYAKSLID